MPQSPETKAGPSVHDSLLKTRIMSGLLLGDRVVRVNKQRVDASQQDLTQSPLAVKELDETVIVLSAKNTRSKQYQTNTWEQRKQSE